MATITEYDKRLVWGNIAVLFLAQAIMGGQLAMIFIVGGLAGNMLAPHPCLATLPISFTVLGTMIAARPLSSFMQKHGRKPGFFLGAIAGMVGAIISTSGLIYANFFLFISGHLFTGVYMATQGFYRFAATDSAPEHLKPIAISLVLAGGLIAAILGPQLTILTADQFAIPFLGTFLSVAMLNLMGLVIFPFFRAPASKRKTVRVSERSTLDLLSEPKVLIAIICAMVSYALMNLVMTSTPLAMVGCGHSQADASNVVSAHVLAMFAPSFFTGALIAYFGALRITTAGTLILAFSGIAGLTGIQLENFFITLILLGIGWNFGFIGASSMLIQSVRPEDQNRAQGLNDMIVFGGVTVASLSSGGLMNCGASSPEAGWFLVNWAMLPFLALSFFALFSAKKIHYSSPG